MRDQPDAVIVCERPGAAALKLGCASATMKTTRYFEEQVLRKRPYIDRSWCVQVLAAPIRREIQPNGRVRCWGAIVDPRDNKTRFLRVVTLEDGETIHNAFFDRDFEDDQ